MAKISKTDAEWQASLTPEQYRVTRKAGTEPAFSGRYYKNKESGMYRCVCCLTPLFDAAHKYDSGSGWPSYWQPIDDQAVTAVTDTTHGMRRVEIRCSACDAHLGHVFDDGPAPTGQRYCINSAALDFDQGGK